MGSLESGLPLKRDPHLARASSAANRNERHQFGQRLRSRFARLVLFKKIDYLQWICTVAVFFFFVVFFQMCLPGSMVEKSGNILEENEAISGDLDFLKELGLLDFGEDLKFEPSKLLARFQKEAREVNGSYGLRRGGRKPQLALVFADLLVDPKQILMATVASALREIGYAIEVYSLEDGPSRAVWNNIGAQVHIIEIRKNVKICVDWLNYDGVVVNSLEVMEVFLSLMQEPFKSVPLIWTVHERGLASRWRDYISNGQDELLNYWKKVFNRASVVVFPNYALPLLYSACDSGNYFVIPGSPAEAWEANKLMASPKYISRVEMNYGVEDFVIVMVGNPLLYRGLWLDNALILQSLLPSQNVNSHLKIVVLSGDSNGNYSVAVEAIAHNLGYPSGIVKHFGIDHEETVLGIANLVIYGSFVEEQSFPEILVKAMCLGKPIIAPNLAMIRKYVEDRVNGYLFPKKNTIVLKNILLQVISNGKLSPLARNIASIGKQTAKNLIVSESVEGYASLLGSILKLPSEVASVGPVSEIPKKLKTEWQWYLFDKIGDSMDQNITLREDIFLDKVEKYFVNGSQRENSATFSSGNATFLYSIWEEHKYNEMANAKKKREDDELKERTDQPRGTWEEVYRSAKKADRSRNDLHERDDGELERTGQPLSIYEPYFGEGTWPFLHTTSLYRGIGLTTKGRRPGADDIDASSRLPLLANSYYRDLLGEFGAFFALAYRIDRVHRNAWIGFQSWRTTSRKECLSKIAERALLDDIQARKHADTLYFWARMDSDPRNPLKLDFWSFCDAINAGNCKFAFSEALKKMYGIKQNPTSLPPMPLDGVDTWSVRHSWVLPTRSFLEFVMFSRMFVDALDAKFYDDHHQSGHCPLSLFKDKHCYSRLLEVLVNVWAYHSSRRIVYINPQTGSIQEHHALKTRRGNMWAKWFNFNMLKDMDEDLAEEADTDSSSATGTGRWKRRRRLWPATGEVFWQGMIEREKSLRNKEKEKKRQQSKDKISRIRKRSHQKALGRYVKPPPQGKIVISNTTEGVSDNLR